jgi:DNA-binding response OmpR family regulator
MRLLIVEDEPAIAMGLRDDLGLEGFDVDVAADGVTAETRARETPYDLILLDVMLPGKDGFEVCKALRSSGIATPIIMLTAKGQVVDRVVGRTAKVPCPPTRTAGTPAQPPRRGAIAAGPGPSGGA